MTCMVPMRHRPASWARSSRSISLDEVEAKRSALWLSAPRVLASLTPEADRPSSIWVLRSASAACCSPVTARLVRATCLVRSTAGGITMRVSRLSRQLNVAMAMAVAITVVRLEAIEVAVLLTTLLRPLTSLTIRLCTSPPRLRMKKPRDCRCRWVNTLVRSVCMTRWPRVAEIQVWRMPSTWVNTAMAIMAPTHHSSTGMSWVGIATSTISRIRNG